MPGQDNLCALGGGQRITRQQEIRPQSSNKPEGLPGLQPGGQHLLQVGQLGGQRRPLVGLHHPLRLAEEEQHPLQVLRVVVTQRPTLSDPPPIPAIPIFRGGFSREEGGRGGTSPPPEGVPHSWPTPTPRFLF